MNLGNLALQVPPNACRNQMRRWGGGADGTAGGYPYASSRRGESSFSDSEGEFKVSALRASRVKLSTYTQSSNPRTARPGRPLGRETQGSTATTLCLNGKVGEQRVPK
jgi:hypothetical protein